MTVKAVPTIQVDNHLTCVTEWRFADGAETGRHRHAMDYVVTPLCDGILKIVDAEGNETLSNLKKGQSYFREAGVEHNVINASGEEFAFVEIEFKTTVK